MHWYMAMNYREIGKRLPHDYQVGGQLVNALVSALEKQGLLPHKLNPLDLKKPTILQEQLITSEKEVWSSFLGKDIVISSPPEELFTVLSKTKEIGWTQAEPHFLPKIELKQNSDFPGWIIKPEEWYWEKIKEGIVAKDAATLERIWVIVDGSQKPQYKDGKQMYENDPFASVLSQLRRDRKIQVPDWCKNIPKDSRFGISNDELQTSVNPAIADFLGVQPEQVRLLRAIEFNILGNLAHREWEKTDTWEWFQDKLRGGDRLIGGDSDAGGLADVGSNVFGNMREDDIGFRPLVAFPHS